MLLDGVLYLFLRENNSKRLRYLESYIFSEIIDEGFACTAQIAKLYYTNPLFYQNVLNIYILSNWDIAMSYLVQFVKGSLYSTLKVCSISRLLCNIQIHWSSSSGCRRKRSSSFSTTWRGARRSTWQLKHSRNRVGGSTPST